MCGVITYFERVYWDTLFLIFWKQETITHEPRKEENHILIGFDRVSFR